MKIRNKHNKFPPTIENNDFLKSKFKKDAIKLPLHTPVSGNGIKTNNAKYKYLLFLFFIFSLFFSIVVSNFENIFSKGLNFFKNFFTLLKKTNKNNVKNILAKKQVINAKIGDILFAPSSFSLIAKGKASLPSKTGSKHIIKTASHIKLLKFSIKKVFKISI